MLDSSVLTLTRRDETSEEGLLCQELWRALVQSGRTILIPAPAFAEYVRHPPHDPPPRQRYVESIAFDDRAALICGKLFPKRVFVEHKTPDTTFTVLKYDSMIVACAIRGGAGVLVSRDNAQIKLATAVRMAALRPADLLTQFRLFTQQPRAPALGSPPTVPQLPSGPGSSSST